MPDGCQDDRAPWQRRRQRLSRNFSAAVATADCFKIISPVAADCLKASFPSLLCSIAMALKIAANTLGNRIVEEYGRHPPHDGYARACFTSALAAEFERAKVPDGTSVRNMM